MRADAYITPVERTVQQLLSEIEQLPNDVLYREPAPGEWPVMSTLAHLEELLPFWAQEAADLAASPGKPVGRTHEDPRRVTPIEQHAQDSLADIVPRIRAALRECVRILRSVPDAGWDATGQHIRTGAMTADQLVQSFLVRHTEEHAAQIRSTLQTLRAART